MRRAASHAEKARTLFPVSRDKGARGAGPGSFRELQPHGGPSPQPLSPKSGRGGFRRLYNRSFVPTRLASRPRTIYRYVDSDIT
jgi:hypothetical protein